MALALTSLKREIKISDTHKVHGDCDFSKAVYYGGNIEKYSEASFPEWIHDILNADITNKIIHQCEYFKFMKLGKPKRKEFIEFIRNTEIPSAMIHVDTDKPLNGSDNEVFITSDEELKHLSIDEESMLGLNIQVTGKLMLYNNAWNKKLQYVRSNKISDYGFCHHWRRRIQIYTVLSIVFSALIVAWAVLYIYHMIHAGIISNCKDTPCYMRFVSLLLISLSLTPKIPLILFMFVMDLIHPEKWKYLLILSVISCIATCLYIACLCLESIENFEKIASDEIYIIGTIFWMTIMDIFVILRRNKNLIYFGWAVAFSLIYIVSSILFLIFGSNERKVDNMDYALTISFTISFIGYIYLYAVVNWGWEEKEPEWMENITCCCVWGAYLGLFAMPTISIWYFVSTNWYQQIPLFIMPFIMLKSMQLLSISITFVMTIFWLFGSCCGVW